MIKTLFLTGAVLPVALLFGLFYYDLHTNEEIINEFSQNLKNWFDNGNYFMYKDVHKIFYIQEELDHETEHDLPSLVLLHGFPTSSHDYEKLLKLFRDEKKFKSLITFDYLGYGFSDKPLDYEYSIFDMADMVDKLLLHLNIEKVYMVAHDISDTVAQELVRRENLNSQNHFKIEKLVLLNGGIFTDIYRSVLSQDILRTQILKDIFSKYVFKFTLFKYSFNKVFGTLNPPSEVELYDFFNSIKFNSGNRVLPLTIGYLNDRFQYGDVWIDALNETVIPTMFIYGPADPVNPRSKFPQKMRESLPNIKLSILSELVGHYPQCEDTFTVSQLIKNFFN